jgi:hypothetical protein
LAVVAGGPSVDTVLVAELIAKLVWWYQGQSPYVFDLRDLTYRLVEYHEREVRARMATGSRVVMALRATAENPTTAPMARTADAAVLVVELAKSARSTAEDTMAAVGRDRFLGCVVLGGGRGAR